MGETFFFFRDYYESIYDDTKHKCLFCEHEEAYLSGMDVELAHSQRTSKRLLDFLCFFPLSARVLGFYICFFGSSTSSTVSASF